MKGERNTIFNVWDGWKYQTNTRIKRTMYRLGGSQGNVKTFIAHHETWHRIGCGADVKLKYKWNITIKHTTYILWCKHHSPNTFIAHDETLRNVASVWGADVKYQDGDKWLVDNSQQTTQIKRRLMFKQHPKRVWTAKRSERKCKTNLLLIHYITHFFVVCARISN